MRRLLISLAATTLAIGALPAQSFPTDDPVLRRIWSLGMDSSQVQSLAQALLDSVGPRLTGTPGQKAGVDWLLARYRAWGIPARAEQYGTWRGWRRGISHIDLLQPRVRSLEGMMLAWSPGTPKGAPVDAPTIIFPNVQSAAELTAWLPQARGKFVLMSMAQPTCRADDNWRQFASDTAAFLRMRDQRTEAVRAWNARLLKASGDSTLGFAMRTLAPKLEAAGARALITNTWSNGWGVDKIFNARTQQVPTVDLSCEDYGLVYRLADNRQNPVLRIQAESENLGEVPVFNVVAELKGTQKPEEYVLLSAHFDSWDGSSGATDNGTGTITMLEAMRILQRVYPQPKRTILVGHWSGEEQGLVGSRAFAADHPEIVKGLQAQFNQDNGTGRVVNVSASGLVDATGALASWLARVPREISRNITFGFAGSPAGGGSDNASFACYGAPGFGLGSLSWDYGTYTWHTNRDTYDKIVWDDVKNNVVLTAMLAYLASEDPVTVSRTRANVFNFNGRPGEWPTCGVPPRKSSEWTR
ncbi:MAG TPA: M28 family peptidase [Gemmatimonadaceae bacterium]|nr:M28 family peptidase [Gemmatimonadaceae bacterium]